MENYIVKNITILNENQVNLLNRLGFRIPSFIGHDREVKSGDWYFEKMYETCGGVFVLGIRIHSYYFGDSHCEKFIQIKTPRDSWWSDWWHINEFIKEMNAFLQELKSDLSDLEIVGIIEKVDSVNGE